MPLCRGALTIEHMVSMLLQALRETRNDQLDELYMILNYVKVVKK
ncbi:hypothetical protein [Tepidibacillus sp. LV47]